jgi:hypothetical protein
VNFDASSDTGVWSQLTYYNGLGRCSATGEPTAATVCSWKSLFDLYNLWIYVHIKNLGGHS